MSKEIQRWKYTIYSHLSPIFLAVVAEIICSFSFSFSLFVCIVWTTVRFILWIVFKLQRNGDYVRWLSASEYMFAFCVLNLICTAYIPIGLWLHDILSLVRWVSRSIEWNKAYSQHFQQITILGRCQCTLSAHGVSLFLCV